MANSANTLDTLNGLFKEIYADKIEKLIPEGAILVKEIPFASRDRQLGNLYHQPVVLGLEHGVTFAGADEDAFNLNAPVAGQIKDGQVRGTQMVLRSVLGYASASRAAGSGQKAFEDATKFLVGNMLRSITKKLEIELLYGDVGYGEVLSTAANVITIKTSEWAPGIWAGAENLPIEIRSADGLTIRGETTVTAVSLSARTVTVSALPAGVVATDIIWHKGAFGNEFAGLHKILTNTGTLFNINATEFNLWKGNEFSASSAALSFAKVQDAIAKAVEKGLETDVMVLVNPNTWSDLLTEQAALRQYDSSYTTDTTENGSQRIRFYSQNGRAEIVPSIYVKEGFAYVMSKDEMLRIGSTDITFRRPGQGEEFFRELENSAGYEMRAYTDQALFCYAPGRNTLIKDIVN